MTDKNGQRRKPGKRRQKIQREKLRKKLLTDNRAPEEEEEKYVENNTKEIISNWWVNPYLTKLYEYKGNQPKVCKELEGVNHRTLYHYRKTHPEFALAEKEVMERIRADIFEMMHNRAVINTPVLIKLFEKYYGGAPQVIELLQGGLNEEEKNKELSVDDVEDIEKKREMLVKALKVLRKNQSEEVQDAEFEIKEKFSK